MYNNTVSEHIDTFFVENTAREKMESILVPICDDCVTSICSSIESCAYIIFLGKNINKLALAFITPL